VNPYRGDFAMKARPRARFALATKELPSRVLHVVDSAEAIWTRGWRRNAPARFERLTAVMSCGRRLASVTLHHEPPTRFELCDYCLAAQVADHLGINKPLAAPTRLARVPLDDLDKVEREIGAPASRAIRRARLEVSA
jgi:hypothetical protein